MDSFSIGETVWCKIKGYPWWPARVLDESEATEQVKKARKGRTGQLLVRYYGTYEFGWVSPEPQSMKAYEENKDELSGKKKGSDFARAIDEADNKGFQFPKTASRSESKPASDEGKQKRKSSADGSSKKRAKKAEGDAADGDQGGEDGEDDEENERIVVSKDKPKKSSSSKRRKDDEEDGADDQQHGGEGAGDAAENGDGKKSKSSKRKGTDEESSRKKHKKSEDGEDGASEDKASKKKHKSEEEKAAKQREKEEKKKLKKEEKEKEKKEKKDEKEKEKKDKKAKEPKTDAKGPSFNALKHWQEVRANLYTAVTKKNDFGAASKLLEEIEANDLTLEVLKITKLGKVIKVITKCDPTMGEEFRIVPRAHKLYALWSEMNLKRGGAAGDKGDDAQMDEEESKPSAEASSTEDVPADAAKTAPAAAGDGAEPAAADRETKAPEPSESLAPAADLKEA